MQQQSHPKLKHFIKGAAIIITAALVIFAVYGWAVGWFRDLESMRAFVSQAGAFGPAAFIAIQILQVVLPFIPGGVTLATGVAAFGPYWGFLLNYIGVAIGSGINFGLVRRFGKPALLHLVDEAAYHKYIGRIEHSKGFRRFFAIAILLPFFPDDTLCLIAGMTDMSWKEFWLIILIGKIPTIAVYSVVLLTAGHVFSFVK